MRRRSLRSRLKVMERLSVPENTWFDFDLFDVQDVREWWQCWQKCDLDLGSDLHRSETCRYLPTTCVREVLLKMWGREAEQETWKSKLFVVTNFTKSFFQFRPPCVPPWSALPQPRTEDPAPQFANVFEGLPYSTLFFQSWTLALSRFALFGLCLSSSEACQCRSPVEEIKSWWYWRWWHW